MRKTEYISTEYNRFSYKTDKAESRIGHNLKKLFKDEELYRDRDSQIKAIEDTFEAVKKPVNEIDFLARVFACSRTILSLTQSS